MSFAALDRGFTSAYHFFQEGARQASQKHIGSAL